MATGIDVCAHLRAVRTMYGMSQRELAKRAGVTNGLISPIEQKHAAHFLVRFRRHARQSEDVKR